MGLNIYPGKTRFAFWGFVEFRKALGRFIKIDIGDFKGFGGQREWKEVKDPLKYLINHSDVEGSIGPSRLVKILPRLKAALKLWQKESDADLKVYYEHVIIPETENLIEGMEEAIKTNKRLTFHG